MKHVLASFVVLFIGSLATARQSAPLGLSAPPADRPLHFLADEHGALWIRGATYKSSVSSAGALYIPYLGSDAPRNYPVEFAVRSCTVGELELDVAGREVKENGLSLDLHRDSFVERWTYGKAQAEQSFHFAELPNRGELRISIAWSSDLEPSVDASGFLWSNELGGVRYGRATALDAAGRKLALSTELVGDEIVIVVPAKFVAEAELPLVVDPIMGTVFGIDTSTFNNFDPESAFDASSDTWLVVYSEQFSGSDCDVYATRRDSAGGFLAGGYVDNSSQSWLYSQVANVNYGNWALVVAQVPNTSPAPGSQIKARISSSQALAWGAVLTVNDAGLHNTRPDCGGDPYALQASGFIVAWKREDIYTQFVYRNINPDGSFVQAAPVELSACLPGGGCQFGDILSVSQSNSGRSWNILSWDRCTNCPNLNYNLRGRSVDYAGVLQTATWNLGDNASGVMTPDGAVSPLLSFSDNRFLVAAVLTSNTAPFRDELQFVLRQPTGAALSTKLLSQFEPRFANNYAVSAIEVDGNRFLVSYESDAPGSPHVVVLSILDGQLVLAEPSRNLGASSADPAVGPLGISSRQSSGGLAGRELCTWATRASVASHSNIVGAFFAPQQGGSWATFCAGDGSGVACPCGNNGGPGRGCGTSVNASGALLLGSGVASTTADTFALSLAYAPVGVAALFFQGTSESAAGAGVVFGDGVRCVTGTIIRLGIKTTTSNALFGGVATYPAAGDAAITVRGAVPSTGAVRLYQAWFRNSASFCTASTFNLSNGLRVTWLP